MRGTLMKLATLSLAVSLVACQGLAKGQTSAEDREKVRIAAAKLQAAMNAQNAWIQKNLEPQLEASDAWKDRLKAQQAFDAQMQSLRDTCTKAGEQLQETPEPIEKYLTCIPKPGAAPPAKK